MAVYPYTLNGIKRDTKFHNCHIMSVTMQKMFVNLSPVVQSILNFTKSFAADSPSPTVVTKSIVMIFFAEKFFSAKNGRIFVLTRC